MTAPSGFVADDHRRRTLAVLATVSVPPALAAAVVVGAAVGVATGALGGLLVALVVLVGVAGALSAILWARSARQTGAPAAVPADPARHARLVNLVDGLAVSAGVRPPHLRVVDQPGANLAVVGRDPAHATLVVTSGLLDVLTRMELEGALATGVASLRRRDEEPGTVAASVGPLDVAARGVRLAVNAGRDRVVDEAAAALTRYPPGLVAAYRRMSEAGTSVAGVTRAQAHLWVVDPDPSGPPPPYRTPLDQRIDALGEL